MALFRRKKKSRKKTKISSATIITSCTQINGDLKGSDTIHIDGVIIGNITADNAVMLGRSGYVKGSITAKHAIISGTLEGDISCKSLEIMQTGRLLGVVEAKEIIINGTFHGTLNAKEKIFIRSHGKVDADQVSSEKLTVNGKLSGMNIATKELIVENRGDVSGKIDTLSIRVMGNGKIQNIPKATKEETD